MKTLMKTLLPLLLLAGVSATVFIILDNPVQTGQTEAEAENIIAVDVMNITGKDYQFVIDSQGIIEPAIQTSLTAQVSGQVLWISERFSDGGAFQTGDILVRLDDRDYRADIKIAESALILAQQQLAEEKARARQASEDWKRLGKKGKPGDLVLRLPQLEAARANKLSAEAQVTRSRLALERTVIKAPYQGRILSRHVGHGQVVSPNTVIADIYATDHVEIRLPFTGRDLPLIPDPAQSRARVLLTTGSQQQFAARLARMENAVDRQTQQFFAVARLDHRMTAGHAWKIGQFVNAQITGKLLPNQFVLPNHVIYQGRFVYVAKDGLLQRRPVTVRWKNDTETVIDTGLDTGDQVVTTTLGQVPSGTRIDLRTKNASGLRDLASGGMGQ